MYKNNKHIYNNFFVGYCHAGGNYHELDNNKKSFYDGLNENLNPKNGPSVVQQKDHILYDPIANNSGRIYRKDIGISDHYGKGGINTCFTIPEALIMRDLNRYTHNNLNATGMKDLYHDIMGKYTHGSYSLSQMLIHHHKNGLSTPKYIYASEDDESGGVGPIHIPSFDKLIGIHKIPRPMKVYTGTYFDPNEIKGKMVMLPSYTSTSVKPHIAKDFGIDYSRGPVDRYGERLRTNPKIKHILRIHLPENHLGLFADPGSRVTGQGELILPRRLRLHIGQSPSHIIHGNFSSHLSPDTSSRLPHEVHMWDARPLPQFSSLDLLKKYLKLDKESNNNN